MKNFEKFEFRTNLPAAALLGLISSTFSTLVSQFIAGSKNESASSGGGYLGYRPGRRNAFAEPPASADRSSSRCWSHDASLGERLGRSSCK
jgi:hypothetical protein